MIIPPLLLTFRCDVHGSSIIPAISLSLQNRLGLSPFVIDHFKFHCSIVYYFMNVVVFHINMFGSAMELSVPNSAVKHLSHTALWPALARVIYSAAAVDNATNGCFLLLHEIAPPLVLNK